MKEWIFRIPAKGRVCSCCGRKLLKGEKVVRFQAKGWNFSSTNLLCESCLKRLAKACRLTSKERKNLLAEEI